MHIHEKGMIYAHAILGLYVHLLCPVSSFSP